MSKFYIYYVGRGEGCDYTIGCNTRVEERTANNIDEIVSYIAESFEESADYVESRIESVKIIEVSSELDLDVDEIVYNIRQSEKAIELADKEAEERVELERLKGKYES